MHMASALVSAGTACTMYAGSAAATGYSIKKFRKENIKEQLPKMAVMGGLVFAGQMINFSIPGTGSSGHLCGAILLSAVLGPYAAFLTLAGVLAVQCLFFADGGLLALGANVWNMAFYGCLFGGAFLWKKVMGGKVTRGKIILGSMTGCILTLQLGAFSVTIETLASGITKLPFLQFAAAMQPIHLAIGAVEGIITSCVLCLIYELRPGLIWTGEKTEQTSGASTQKNRVTYKGALAILGCMALLTGGLLSLTASEKPDGLEWSIEKTAQTTELTNAGELHGWTDQIQSAAAFWPDYSVSGLDSFLGTSLSGIAGIFIIMAICFFVYRRVEHHGSRKMSR